MAPSTRYTTTADGARIALATLGEGLPILCMPPVPFSHLEAGWDLAGQRLWYERLSRHAQVATYDARGIGLSDRARAEFGLEALTSDLQAVAGALEWERFALCGFFNAAPAALAFAASRPAAVSHLVLWGGYARGVDVFAMPVPPATPEAVERTWPVLVETAAHMWTASSEDARDVAAFFRRCVTPDAALRAFAAARAYDVSAELPRVQAPALVMHRPHARGQRNDLAPALAAALPRGELAALAGEAASPFAGDIEAAVEVIERFLGIAAAGRPPLASTGETLDLTPREAEVLRLLARAGEQADRPRTGRERPHGGAAPDQPLPETRLPEPHRGHRLRAHPRLRLTLGRSIPRQATRFP